MPPFEISFASLTRNKLIDLYTYYSILILQSPVHRMTCQEWKEFIPATFWQHLNRFPGTASCDGVRSGN